MRNSKAHRSFYAVFSFLFLLISAESFAQKEEEVISSFEKRVAIFENFFSLTPKLLEKQRDKISPTGYAFFYSRFDNSKISYDVRKTESLISPYMGYITLSYSDTTSTNCGDIPFISQEKPFSTIEMARQNRDNNSCYRKTLRREVKFIFAFQKNNWVFKEALNTYTNEPAPWFSTIFGKPVSGRFYVEDNEFWKKLIE